MSTTHKNFALQVLNERFGPIVTEVASQLFDCPLSLYQLARNCSVPLSKIRESLCILIKFNVVSFRLKEHNENSAVYSFLYDSIIILLRYPKYIRFIRDKFGHATEVLLEEVLLKGHTTASNVLLKTVARLKAEHEPDVSFGNLKEKFVSLVNARYIMRYKNEKIKINPVDLNWTFRAPTIDVNALVAASNSKLPRSGSYEFPDDGVDWILNPDRFHQDMRDEIIVAAVARKFDENAGELMRVFLEQMYIRSTPWADISNPVTVLEIKTAVQKLNTHPDLINYFDQYVTLLAEDSNGLWAKAGDASGGSYEIRMKHIITLLTWETLEHIVTERFDTKTSRIFRLIKSQYAVDLDQIQNLVMLSGKQAKLFTYNLFDNNFLVAVDVKGSGGGGGGGGAGGASQSGRHLSLFRIKLGECVRTVHQLCYKSFYNLQYRRQHEHTLNQAFIDKKQRVDTIVLSMRSQGSNEENLEQFLDLVTPLEKELLEKVEKTFKQINTAELAVDDTTFLLELFMKYDKSK